MCDRRDTFQYIPLEDGLRSFLANREVFDEVCIIVILSNNACNNILFFVKVFRSHSRTDGLMQTSVMHHCSRHMSFFEFTLMLYNSSYTMMRLKSVIL